MSDTLRRLVSNWQRIGGTDQPNNTTSPAMRRVFHLMPIHHTDAQLEAILTQWQTDMQQADSLLDPAINMLGLQPESRICEAVWGLQSALTQAVAAHIGATTEWLDWYAYENDFGREALEAGPEDAMRPIRSIRDLVWVMTCQD